MISDGTLTHTSPVQQRSGSVPEFPGINDSTHIAPGANQQQPATQPMPSHEYSISISHVSQYFALKGQEPVHALADVNISVKDGEFVSLVGPSGCGKTSLLNMVAGLAQPSSGAVRLWGKKVEEVRNDIGYMFVQDGLLPWRTTLQNVAVGLELHGADKAERLTKAKELITSVGLAGFENAYKWQLSAGMRQRAAIARTLATDPKLILLDEPFSALDPQTRVMLQLQFLNLWERRGASVLMVTHDIDEAILLSDRVIVLSGRPGAVAADLTITLPRPRELKSLRYTQEFSRYASSIAQYMGNED